jgi:hypothetical protein
MMKPSRVSLSALLFALALFATRHSRAASLFIPSGPQPGASYTNAPAPIKRSSLVILNPQWLDPAVQSGTGLRSGDPLTLNLFADLTLSGTVTETRHIAPGRFVVIASLGQQAGDFACLAFNQGVLVGNLYVRGLGQYAVRYAGNGQLWIFEMAAPTGFPGNGGITPHSVCAIPSAAGGAGSFRRASGDSFARAAIPSMAGTSCGPAVPTTVDVLSLYTSAALAAAGSMAALNAGLDGNWTMANLCFKNSDIDVRYREVGRIACAYTGDSGGSADLTWETNDPTVQAERSTYGADLVAMFVNANQGVAWVLQVMDSSASTYAYSVNGWSWQDFLGHEAGHNMGNFHDLANSGSLGSPVFPYSYGENFISFGVTYGDIMCYPGTKVPFQSNSTLTYGGSAMGLASNADNAHSMNQTGPFVATWEADVLGDAPPSVSISSPADGSVYNVLDAVTLTAAASDPDGTISQVDYYMDDRLLGSSTTAPYSLVYGPLPSGSHQIFARAYDNVGNETPSCYINITVNSNLPAAWQVVDLKGTEERLCPWGLASYSGGVYTLVNSDWGFGTANGDGAEFADQTFCGDGDFVARIASFPAGTGAYAGLAVRQGTAKVSSQVEILYTPSGFAWRGTGALTSSGVISATPWVKIHRTGVLYNLYYSSDGATWTQFPSSSQILVGAQPYAGLVAGNDQGTTAYSFAFDNVSLTENCYTPTVTATNTPTVTLTRTPTSSFTVSPTGTPSKTATSTFTDTLTFTFSPTASPTRTASQTPTSTLTWTSSPTGTSSYTTSPTVSPTRTPSPTVTVTYTLSPTRTMSPTISPSFTCSPTITQTFTFSPTPTQSASFTGTGTPIPTLTSSPTSTWTPSTTPTSSDSVTPSISPTESGTATLTVTPTTTHTPTASETATASVTPADSFTDTPSVSPTPSLTPTSTALGTATVSWTLTSSPSAADTASDSPTFTSTVTWTLTPSPTASDTPSATSTPSVSPYLSPTPSPTPVLDLSRPLAIVDFAVVPNPLHGAGLITYSLTHPGVQSVRLRIYSAAMNLVREVTCSGYPGRNWVPLDALPSGGVYFYTLEASDGVQSALVHGKVMSLP